MQNQSDLPAVIAKWLFRLGCFWALILIYGLWPVLVMLRYNQSIPWRLICGLLPGFGVWCGWYWRSRRRRRLNPSAIFWSISAAYNLLGSAFWVVINMQWGNSFVSWDSVYFWWWAAVSIASLAALRLEFTISREMERATSSSNPLDIAPAAVEK